ncbi:DUF5991 domain-containing protein [Segatella oulorum]|uniref:DUF5991 domain-containing protein n=1 Tax=Segatella oulorum TaxID=28136 RepID=UPI0028E97892|nr:DUF5991 domain-containing protein [Segatella oulorum]
MKRFIFLAIIAIGCISCTARRKTLKTSFPSRKDTLFVDKERCAVSFKLSLGELNELRKTYKTKEEFYTTSDGIAEDKFQIKTFLEENNISIIYADTTIGVIRFKDCDVNITNTPIIETIWTSIILYNHGKKYAVMQYPDFDFTSKYFDLHEGNILGEKHIKQVQNSKWFGDYEYFISDTTVVPSPFIEYTLSIAADRCVFCGNGQMTAFEIQCSVKNETEDKLSLDFVKSLSEDTPMPNIDRSVSPTVNLYHKKGKYYLESPYISNSEGKENVKIECRKIK